MTSERSRMLLYHFTRLKNVAAIKKHGLLPHGSDSAPSPAAERMAGGQRVVWLCTTPTSRSRIMSALQTGCSQHEQHSHSHQNRARHHHITLTIATTAPETPSVSDLMKILTTAKEVKASNAKYDDVTGTVLIGKQKYKLEDGAS